MYHEIILAFAPWLCFALFVFIARLFIVFARKRRNIAIALGVVVHMFLPDPKIESTMKLLQEIKQEKRVERKDSQDK